MTLLVLGGYGAVGIAVTRTLAPRFPGRVLVGGRDLERARRAAAEAGSARPVRVDVTDLAALERTLTEHAVETVVLCVEPPDAELARTLLARGVHLVDVGASHRLLEGVERHADLARARAATAVLSVGVAPGLTNLLARRAHDDLGGADRLDLAVLLGAGERHGTDAVRWTLRGLADPVAGTARRVSLPGFGSRTLHPFPFSDQHSLRGTLGVADVTTRLGLDSRPLTATLFGLRRAGVFRHLVRHPRAQSLLTAGIARLHVGGDRFAVVAEATRGNRRAAYAVTGREQGRVTGLVAAHVTARLLTGGLPPGVHHVDELSALADLPEELARYGVTVWRDGRDTPPG